MPLLSRHAPKLLRNAGSKRHASDDDHEEPIAKRRSSPAKRQTQNEEDIYAEPASSGEDEELRKPAPRTTLPSKPAIPITDELSLPQKKSARSQPVTQITSSGTARTRQTDKGKRKSDDDKENTSREAPQSSSKSSQDDSLGFGLEHASQRSNKSSKAIKFGSKNKTGNIHAVQPPANKCRKVPNIRVPRSIRGTNKQSSGTMALSDDDGNISDVSMMSNVDKDTELRTVEKKKPTAKYTNDADGTILNHEELGAEFPNMPEDKDLRRTTRRAKPTVLHDQLGDWMQERAPGSSQPASSAPQEDYGDLKDYLEQLPAEEKEGTVCPLCRAPVKEDDYWQFWKGQEKTVKNQNKFCRSHRTASAWEEYRSEGYPDIDWDTLPQRIKKYRMDLFKILNDDRPSVYRERYEPIALTGKAAAVPSKRQDLPELL
jgi:hypothetical protein